MRKTLIILLVIILSLSTACASKNTKSQEDVIKIGLLKYRADDTFIDLLTANLASKLEQCSNQLGKKIIFTELSSQNSQSVQNNQIDRLIEHDYDLICVNLMDRTSASHIILKCKEAQKPLILFNREPVSKDLKLWDQVYYVGVDSSQAGKMQGEIVLDLLKDKFEAVDHNGDAKISYVVLEGERGHQDAILRTKNVVATLNEAGYKLERLAGASANWSMDQAEAKMEQWVQEFPNQIELVIANNDDMAIGASNVLAKEQKLPVIVGIDATFKGLEAVEKGQIYGTILNDSKGISDSIAKLALALNKVEGYSFADIDYLKDNIVRVPHQKVTKANLAEIKNYLERE